MKKIAFMACVAAVVASAGADENRIRYMSDTYLQSDGTQAIDIGLLATTNMRMEVVFEPTLTNGTRYLFGSASSTAGNSPMKYGFYVQNGPFSFTSGTGGTGGNWNAGWYGTKIAGTRSRFKAVYDFPTKTGELWSGDVRVYSVTTLTTPGFETNTCTVTLFCNHSNPTSYVDPFGGKVYSFRLFDKGTLVRDMIPYGRGAVTGLLDRCSGKVYTNVRAGGHAFTLGTDDGYVRSDRTKRGGQWIDTGYSVNPQTKIEVDFAMMDVSTVQQRIFGADTVGGHGLCFYVSGSKYFAWYCRDNPVPGWGGESTGILVDGERRKATVDIPNRTVTLTGAGGETVYAGTITYDCENTATTSIRLFGGAYTNATGTVVQNCPASVKIFGAKFWDGETLVRDYEPRIVDNVEGLYEKVSGKLVPGNLSGSETGNFRLKAGGNILCESANGLGTAANADAYLEDTGAQAINTGYYTSRKTRLEIDFAINDFGGTAYYFGAVGTSATNNVGLYYQLNNGNRNFSFRYWKGNGTNWPLVNNNKATPERYQVVMDLSAAKGYWYADGVQKKSVSLSLPSSGDFKNTVPLLIMYTQNGGQGAVGRLYSFAIYEDDVLVHQYTPCVENGIAGVWDSVGKQFLSNSRAANGSGFTFHGAGVDGGGMVFTEQPQGGRLSRGHTLTLTAFAPGAAGYQWLKNGAIVEGATGRTLEVAYGEGGTTDTYQCVSRYELFGYGASEVAQVENLPSGTMMIFR